jgi:hypothetical protein
MDIRIREGIYIHNDAAGVETSIRPETVGFERKGVIWFSDVTKTVRIGFSKEFCKENKMMFQVAPSISDREISLRQALLIVQEGCRNAGIDPTEVMHKLNEL